MHIPSLLFHCKLYIVYKPVYIHIHMHNQHTLISETMLWDYLNVLCLAQYICMLGYELLNRA